MIKLSLDTIKRRLRRYKPATSQDVLRKCMFPLVFIDEGQFRSVYHILGTEYLLKMPLMEWEAWRWKGPKEKWIRKHINHARIEINAHTIIPTTTRDNVKALHKFLPEVPWSDWDTGVILMRKYRKPTQREWDKRGLKLLAAIEAVQRHNTDIRLHNCGIDSQGNLKVIDLGCLELTRD